MSTISPIEPMREAEQKRYDEKQLEIEPAEIKADEQKLTPEVRAATDQQDQKTTVQAFQYTGKGSFVDKVF